MILNVCWKEMIQEIRIYRRYEKEPCSYKSDNRLRSISWSLFLLILTTPVMFALDIVLLPFELFYLICKKIVYGKGEDKE